jgi:hypothetical protein
VSFGHARQVWVLVSALCARGPLGTAGPTFGERDVFGFSDTNICIHGRDYGEGVGHLWSYPPRKVKIFLREEKLGKMRWGRNLEGKSAGEAPGEAHFLPFGLIVCRLRTDVY